MESGQKSACKWGLDDLHRQLAEGNNAPETRYWLKAVLFNCHYAMESCGYWGYPKWVENKARENGLDPSDPAILRRLLWHFTTFSA